MSTDALLLDEPRSSEDGKHAIVGSVESIYLVATVSSRLASTRFGVLFPSLVGNIIGDISLVTALAHAQFVAHEGPRISDADMQCSSFVSVGAIVLLANEARENREPATMNDERRPGRELTCPLSGICSRPPR